MDELKFKKSCWIMTWVKKERCWSKLVLFHKDVSIFGLWMTFILTSLTIIIIQRSYHVDWGEDGCHDMITTSLEPRTHPWKPSGCVMKQYNRSEIFQCLKKVEGGRNTTIAFLGDSHQREIYNTLLDSIGWNMTFRMLKGQPKGFFYNSEINLFMSCKFMPLLNDSFRQTFEEWEVLRKSTLRLWSSARVIGKENMDSYRDDVHVGPKALARLLEITLNYLCNPRMNVPEDFCCSPAKSREPSWISASRIGIGACGAVLVILSWLQNYRKKEIDCQTEFQISNIGTQQPTSGDQILSRFSDFAILVVKSGIYLGYIYLCDSIPFFATVDKGPSCWLFALIIVIWSFVVPKPSHESKNLILDFLQELRGVLMISLMMLKLAQMNPSGKDSKMVSFFWSSLLTLAGMEFFCELRNAPSTGLRYYSSKLFNLTALPYVLCMALDQTFLSCNLMPELLIFFHLFYFVFKLPLLPWKQDELARNLILDIVRWIGVGVLTIGITMYKNIIFFHPLLRPVFATEEGFIPNLWIKRWEQHKASYALGVLCGIIFENRATCSSCYRKIFPIEKRKASMLLPLALVGLCIASVCYAFPNYINTGLINSIDRELFLFIFLVFGCIIIRFGFLKFWKYVSAPFLGVLWIEISLLHNHIWMKYDGTSFIKLTSSHSFINAGILFSIMVFASSDFNSLTSLKFLL